jgi:hypothetical protein
MEDKGDRGGGRQRRGKTLVLLLAIEIAFAFCLHNCHVQEWISDEEAACPIL